MSCAERCTIPEQGVFLEVGQRVTQVGNAGAIGIHRGVKRIDSTTQVRDISGVSGDIRGVGINFTIGGV